MLGIIDEHYRPTFRTISLPSFLESDLSRRLLGSENTTLRYFETSVISNRYGVRVSAVVKTDGAEISAQSTAFNPLQSRVTL